MIWRNSRLQMIGPIRLRWAVRPRRQFRRRFVRRDRRRRTGLIAHEKAPARAPSIALSKFAARMLRRDGMRPDFDSLGHRCQSAISFRRTHTANHSARGASSSPARSSRRSRRRRRCGASLAVGSNAAVAFRAAPRRAWAACQPAAGVARAHARLRRRMAENETLRRRSR